MVTDFIKPSLLDATIRAESFPCLKDDRLAVRDYLDATVYPAIQGKGGGVVDSEGRFIYGSSVYNNIVGQEGSYACDSIATADEEVVYLGAFYSCWGHCLTDFLRRLWFLKARDVDGRIKGMRFVYVRSSWGGSGTLPENFWRLLSHLGFERETLTEVKGPTRFRRVWIPDPCFYKDEERAAERYTKEYAQLIDELVSAVTGGRKIEPTRSVYFSRLNWKNPGWGPNRERGAPLVEKAFRRKGFEIVYPEQLSFDELVLLLQECKEFASTDGSCAHNAVFLPRGATSIVVRKADYVNLYQPAINQMRGLAPIYIDANLSNMLANPKLPMVGPFFLYVNSRLSAFSGISAHFPLREYLAYVWRHYDRKILSAMPWILPFRRGFSKFAKRVLCR